MPFLLVLAGALAVAYQSQSSQLGFEDYPRDALVHNKSAGAIIEMLIDPAGKVIRCTAEEVVEDPDLAGEICPLERRQRWKPAMGSDGKPAYALVRGLLKFFIPGTRSGDIVGGLKQAPDTEFKVSGLPEGKQSMTATILLAVDAQGMITECAPDPSMDLKALSEQVCKDKGRWAVEKLLDGGGQAIAYVTTKKVGFAIAEPGRR